MSTHFWQQLQRPIFGLSPMDGVSDHPFRFITKKYGRVDLIYTEFTSVEGLCHGAEKLLKEFIYDETQRPVIGQIYGSTPRFFRQAATLLCQLGFDGVDINMGCPAKNVAHSGAGAALIKTPKLAQEIIAETKAGVQDWFNGATVADCPDMAPSIVATVERRNAELPAMYQQRRIVPVSVKTRIGYDVPIVHEWISYVLEMEPVAIALHGRTLKQQYSGFANWDEIGKAAELIKQTPTLILGNGDIQSKADGLQKISQHGLDGVLIGRASFGNPFVFNPEKAQQYNIFHIALEHARLFENTYQSNHNYTFLPMRKHLGWYVRSIPGAKEVRQRIFQTSNAAEVEAVFHQFELI